MIYAISVDSKKFHWSHDLIALGCQVWIIITPLKAASLPAWLHLGIEVVVPVTGRGIQEPSWRHSTATVRWPCSQSLLTTFPSSTAVFTFMIPVLLVLDLTRDMLWSPILHFILVGVLIQALPQAGPQNSNLSAGCRANHARSKTDCALLTLQLLRHFFSSSHFGWFTGVQLLGMKNPTKAGFLVTFPCITSPFCFLGSAFHFLSKKE